MRHFAEGYIMGACAQCRVYGVHRKPILAPRWEVLEWTVHSRVRYCTNAHLSIEVIKIESGKGLSKFRN